MSTTLRFRDHAEFHRAAWQMAGAGALAGLLAHAVFRGAPAAWAIVFAAAAAIFGAMTPAARRDPDALLPRVGLVVIATLALLMLPRAGQPAAGIAAFAGLFGLAMGWGLSGRRLAAAVAVGAAGVLLSRYVHGSVISAQELAAVPAWGVTALAGAGFAFVSVLTLLPRHVELYRDHVTDTYEAMKGSLAGEVRELCDRGYGLWTKAADTLDERDANRAALAEGVTRLFEVARRWTASNAEGAQANSASLVDRIDGLDARIAATDDAVARAQYEQAKSALAEQLRYLKDIGTNRERVLARMHNYVAAMERLQLAVVNLESTNASRDAGAVGTLMTDLEALGADIDSCSEGLIEADELADAAR